MGHFQRPAWTWTTDRSSNPPSFTAEDYLASFQANVQTIRDDTVSTTYILSAVTAITPAELRRIIIAAAPKSCELDPLPTIFLQEHLDILLPLLTTICNRSIVGVCNITSIIFVYCVNPVSMLCKSRMRYCQPGCYWCHTRQ